MDFQFSRDPFTQQPFARVSMEQEALGRWLSEELGTDPVLLVDILRHAELVSTRKLPQWQYVGRETTLLLLDDAAEISPNLSDEDAEQLAEPDLTLADWNALTACGLDDFIHLLRAWQAYLLN